MVGEFTFNAYLNAGWNCTWCEMLRIFEVNDKLQLIYNLLRI